MHFWSMWKEILAAQLRNCGIVGPVYHHGRLEGKTVSTKMAIDFIYGI